MIQISEGNNHADVVVAAKAAANSNKWPCLQMEDVSLTNLSDLPLLQQKATGGELNLWLQDGF